MYTLGSLFTGIGGIDLAFEREGFEIAYQVEIDEYCNKVLEKHWPNVKRYGDIRTVTDLPAVDVLAGGFPCTDISSAGKREGIKEGNQSGLWIEFARLIGTIRPRIVFLENVAAITHRDGSRVVADLASLGYDAQWGIIPASAVGASHRRARWWCVAYPSSDGFGQSNGGQRQFKTHQQWNDQTTEPRSDNEQSGLNPDSSVLGYTKSSGESPAQQPRQLRGAGQAGGMGNAASIRRETIPAFARIAGAGNINYKGANTSAAATQSILGRAVDGLSRQLDGSRWPARPGQEQYSWEAPRTVSELPNRAARLKALGNAVVPQVVQPFAAAIRAVLEEADRAACTARSGISVPIIDGIQTQA